MEWLIHAKVAPQKSYTFTRRFLISVFLTFLIIIESPTIMHITSDYVYLVPLGDDSFIAEHLSFSLFA